MSKINDDYLSGSKKKPIKQLAGKLKEKQPVRTLAKNIKDKKPVKKLTKKIKNKTLETTIHKLLPKDELSDFETSDKQGKQDIFKSYIKSNWKHFAVAPIPFWLGYAPLGGLFELFTGLSPDTMVESRSVVFFMSLVGAGLFSLYRVAAYSYLDKKLDINSLEKITFDSSKLSQIINEDNLLNKEDNYNLKQFVKEYIFYEPVIYKSSSSKKTFWRTAIDGAPTFIGDAIWSPIYYSTIMGVDDTYKLIALSIFGAINGAIGGNLAALFVDMFNSTTKVHKALTLPKFEKYSQPKKVAITTAAAAIVAFGMINMYNYGSYFPVVPGLDLSDSNKKISLLENKLDEKKTFTDTISWNDALKYFKENNDLEYIKKIK